MVLWIQLLNIIAPWTVPLPAPPVRTYKVRSHRSPGAVYKAKAPPSATPAIAITAVRNGSCSIGTVALEDLEAEGPGEDDVDLEEEPVLLALPFEARKSSQRNSDRALTG